MTNHVHLVLQTTEPNVFFEMHWVNIDHVGWLNHIHEQSGHLAVGQTHQSDPALARLWNTSIYAVTSGNPIQVPIHCERA
jgi:hypothetical protein